MLKTIRHKIVQNKEIRNAGWIIGGKIAQMLIALFIGIIIARYLGPSNYGTINYAMAYVTFFTSICTLGINSIIIKDFTDYPGEQGKALGTAILLRAVSSVLACFLIIILVSVIDKEEKETIIIVGLCSLALFFQIFDTINYWFQFLYKSKITSVVTFIACVITSFYKILILILKKNVKWFAAATLIDYIVLAILLLLAYKKCNGQKLEFSKNKAQNLLKKSYHYILSGMMVAIYTQTDKMMIKQMMDEAEVGYYSAAVSICNMWSFVLVAIIDSVYPTILQLYGKNRKGFERKNKQLYAIVFYVSMVVSIGFLILGNWCVQILYGKEYMPAGEILKIVTWYTGFAYLGVARNAWIVCENRQKYLKYIYLSAALLNVFMNLIFIPVLGAKGAAVASLITQVFTSIIFPIMFKGMRRNVVLMLEAIRFADVW